jgi:hypothetical protein
MGCCIRVSGQAVANTLRFGATAAYLAFCRRTLHRPAAVPGRRPKDLLSTSVGMDLLAREPPARGRARVAPADDVVAYCEQPEAAGAPPSVECAVCKEVVRPAQVVGRPPACLHASTSTASTPGCRTTRPARSAGTTSTRRCWRRWCDRACEVILVLLLLILVSSWW